MEFDKWKGEFSVDDEGTTENEVQDGTQGLLFDFVEYIKVEVITWSLLYLNYIGYCFSLFHVHKILNVS